jgi:hypothetical protein
LAIIVKKKKDQFLSKGVAFGKITDSYPHRKEIHARFTDTRELIKPMLNLVMHNP